MRAILNTIPIRLMKDYRKAGPLLRYNLIDTGDYNIDKTRDARLCVKYLQDLHIFHGFESILFPESTESSLPREICNLEFVEFCSDRFWELGQARKNRVYCALYDVLKEELPCVLEDEELSYVIPFGFDFGVTLEAYARWETAVELEACLVFPTYTTLWLASLTLREPGLEGNYSVRKVRELLGHWFFSHIPDSCTLIPSLRKRIEQNLFKRIIELEEISEMHTYREKLARAWNNGARTSRNLIEEMPLISEKVKQTIRKQWENIAVVSTSISVAIYTQNIINLLPSLIPIPSIGKKIIRTVKRKDFDSPFCMEPWLQCPLPDFTIYSKGSESGYNSRLDNQKASSNLEMRMRSMYKRTQIPNVKLLAMLRSQKGLPLQKTFLGIQFNKYLFYQQYPDLFKQYDKFLYVR